MIISQEKIEDMKIRQTLLEITESCARLGLTEHAKEIGAVSKQYGERLKQPYQPRDKWQRIIPAP